MTAVALAGANALPCESTVRESHVAAGVNRGMTATAAGGENHTVHSPRLRAASNKPTSRHQSLMTHSPNSFVTECSDLHDPHRAEHSAVVAGGGEQPPSPVTKFFRLVTLRKRTVEVTPHRDIDSA